MGRFSAKFRKRRVHPAVVMLACALFAPRGGAAGPEPAEDPRGLEQQIHAPARQGGSASSSRSDAESKLLGPAPSRAPASVEREPVPASMEVGWAAGARSIAALIAVIAMALVLAWLLRRGMRAKGGLRAALGPGGSAPAGVLRVLGRYPIARGQTLVLLQMDQTVLLVAQTYGRGAANLTTLSEVTDPERVASLLLKARESEGETVSQKFRVLMERLNSEPAEQAITVVPPVQRGDWYERGERSAPRAAAHRASPASDRQKEDAVLALKRRLEAMRQDNGVSA